MNRKSIFDRVQDAFVRSRAAFAGKALPDPGELYRGPSTQFAMTGPIGFPGWDEWQKRKGQDAQDEQRARRAVASPWVFSDVTAIANEAAAAELVMKERVKDTLEDVQNHPLELIWERPNEHMGRSFVTSYWVWSYTLVGKAFLFWAPRGNDLAEVWPVPPGMLMPIPDPKTFIRGYMFKSSPTAKPITIPPQFITYSHSVNLFDIRDGLSFLAAAWTGIESDLAAADWNKNFFKESNGVPDGMITLNQETLDEDVPRIRDEIREFFGGTRRGVAVARAGDMDYKPFGRTQKDAEFLSGRAFSQKEIDRTLGFPEGYWSERANRANAEQARDTMISGAVWPLLVRLSEDLNAQQVRTWYGPQFRAEFKDIRAEDRDMKLKEQESRKTHWTVNELREADGKDPLDDPRGDMLIAEIAKGMPIPATPASEQTEAYVQEQETAAGISPGSAQAAPGGPDDAQAAEDTATAPDDAQDVPEDIPGSDLPIHLKLVDLDRWERKSLKALKAGRPALVPFQSDALSQDELGWVMEDLRKARTPEGVKAVFTEYRGELKATTDDDLGDDVWALATSWAEAFLEDEGGDRA